jgi:hypothetical protein
MNKLALWWMISGAVIAVLDAQAAQRDFSTPTAAANALIESAFRQDMPALLEILGPDGKDLVESKDPVLDRARAKAFAIQAHERTEVKRSRTDASRATLVVGKEDWPFPIPIVRQGGKWRFASRAGSQEVLRRRIGANELDAIAICRGYVEAQKQYALEVHDDSGVNQYAQRIISTPGKRDGLAWKNPDGSWGGPVGEAVARALSEGYSESGGPFHGYYFSVLKGQGPAAPMGQLDYVIDGAMIGGFSLIAWPAQYGVTGIQTFIVSYDGIVFQKNLGPETATAAPAIDRYDPTPAWKATNDDWPTRG